MAEQTIAEQQLAAVPPPDPIPVAPEPEAAPKRGRGRPRKTTAAAADSAPRARTPARKASTKQVADSVEGIHQAIGVLVLPRVGRPITGKALADSGKEAGLLWAALAEKYPIIGKLFTGGDSGLVLFQLAMVYMPIVQMAQEEGAAQAAGEPPADMATVFGLGSTPGMGTAFGFPTTP